MCISNVSAGVRRAPLGYAWREDDGRAFIHSPPEWRHVIDRPGGCPTRSMLQVMPLLR